MARKIGDRLEHPCGDCGSPMVLRGSRYGLFWGCTQFPQCRGTHGAHPDGEPLGIPADKATKRKRIEAHDAFDQIWKSEFMTRGQAYAWLADRMGLPEVHFGAFNAEQCDEAIGHVLDLEREISPL